MMQIWKQAELLTLEAAPDAKGWFATNRSGGISGLPESRSRSGSA
jgi:hypothetical protein